MNAITKLALQLWPAHDYEELRQEMGETLSQPDAAFFLAFDGDVDDAACSHVQLLMVWDERELLKNFIYYNSK